MGRGYLDSGRSPLSEPESRAVYRFISRVEPRLTIWFHQPLAVVDESQGSRRLEQMFARLVGLPLKALVDYPGSVANWQNHHDPSATAFVTELPGVRLTSAQAARDAHAVLTLAAALR